MDMDDEVEEKRRLDRARVLIKTPWRLTIQHTINVHIGGETFKVYVVEECGNGTRDCLRRGRSFRGSSEEIDSDESYLGNPTLTSTENMVYEDDMQHLSAPETRPAPCYIATRPGAGIVDHEMTLLSSGQSGYNYPLDTSNSPRVFGRNQRVPTAV